MISTRAILATGLTITLSCSLLRVGVAQDFEVRMIANSKTLSQAVAINSSLEVIGTREVLDGPISTFNGYFRTNDTDVAIEIPKGYTTLEPCALSDNGVVTGHVGRSFTMGKSLLGFVWNSRSKKLMLLEPLESDNVCQAQDISADGKFITGYSTGSNPPRTRPCVWELTDNDKVPVARELPSIILNNPFLQGGRVIISPDGKRIAACISEKQFSPVDFDSSLFIWDRSEDGSWTRRKVSEEQPKLKDMNNAGTMVGTVRLNGFHRACVVSLAGELSLIDLLPGDESNEAYGINESEMVIGLSDDPIGGTGGPTAFVFKAGVVSPLTMPKQTLHSVALGITDSGAICGYLSQDTEEDVGAVGFIRVPVGIPKGKTKSPVLEPAK